MRALVQAIVVELHEHTGRRSRVRLPLAQPLRRLQSSSMASCLLDGFLPSYVTNSLVVAVAAQDFVMRSLMTEPR